MDRRVVPRRHAASRAQNASQRFGSTATGRHTPRVILGRWTASWGQHVASLGVGR